MANERSLPLLLAVTRETDRLNEANPRRQANGGNIVRWPTVAAVMDYLQPGCGWTKDTTQKASKRAERTMSPEGITALIAGVDRALYADAVAHAHERGTRPTGEPPVVPGVTAPLAEDAPEPDPLEDEPIVHPANGLPVDQKGDIIFADRRQQPTDFDVEKLWTAYLEVMQAARPFKRAQKIARAEIQGNLPVGVAHFGDQHMGSWSLEAMRMLEDYKILAQTEGLYANFLGDEADNFIFNFAKWASVMTPNHQRIITEWLMKSVKEKAIAWILGNHLNWSTSAADFDWVAKLAWLEQAFYLGHRGDLHLTVGQETYHFHLAHKAQGGSALNKSNSGRRTADTIGGADIIVEAHLHDPWLHQEYKGNKRQTWMRTGTYKRTDDYADSAGFPQAQWDMPMVILLPDTHRIIPFLDFRDGLETLAALRAQYKARAAALTA